MDRVASAGPLFRAGSSQRDKHAFQRFGHLHSHGDGSPGTAAPTASSVTATATGTAATSPTTSSCTLPGWDFGGPGLGSGGLYK